MHCTYNGLNLFDIMNCICNHLKSPTSGTCISVFAGITVAMGFCFSMHAIIELNSYGCALLQVCCNDEIHSSKPDFECCDKVYLYKPFPDAVCCGGKFYKPVDNFTCCGTRWGRDGQSREGFCVDCVPIILFICGRKNFVTTSVILYFIGYQSLNLFMW